jgi:hypothetical protein
MPPSGLTGPSDLGQFMAPVSPMTMTSLTGPLIKIPPRFFKTKMRWRIGGSLWLIIYIILAVQLIGKSDNGLLVCS